MRRDNGCDPVNYIGSKKHKRWTPGGASGSICPDWTHTVAGRHFGATEPEMWDKWPDTEAQRLLAASVAHGGQRYAAARGVAFCGQVSGRGAWHGYPIPWRDVPKGVRQQLEATGQVTSREIKQGMRAQKFIDPKRNPKWAVVSDDG
jgi:hypothetical protein